MLSLFSRMMDYAVESHCRKDRSGRSVFIPLSRKGAWEPIPSAAQSDSPGVRREILARHTCLRRTKLDSNNSIHYFC